MDENYNRLVELIEDIDFQKTQLLYTLEEMFNFNKMDDISYLLNPFINDVYFYKGVYEIEIIETISNCDDIILFKELERGKQLLVTPIFENPAKMISNDKYIALINEDGKCLILDTKMRINE